MVLAGEGTTDPQLPRLVGFGLGVVRRGRVISPQPTKAWFAATSTA